VFPVTQFDDPITASEPQVTEPSGGPRWYRPTPGRLLGVLLAVEGLLLLSERFRWFLFNAHKGWTVLIAIASVGAFLLLMLLWLVGSLVFGWRFQFSLRSLLVLTVAVAIPFSWLAVEMKKAREQAAVVRAVEEKGGVVWYDFWYNSQPISVSPEPTWLRRLVGDDFLADVTQVYFGKTQATNSAIEQIKGLTQLRGVFLENTHITDAGLEYIEGLAQLEVLWLNETATTDAGLVHLKNLTQLLNLSLDKTLVTDTGLESLRRLTQLSVLHLANTPVTDKGVNELQQALPNCWIER
jgi:hypothetical protein